MSLATTAQPAPPRSLNPQPPRRYTPPMPDPGAPIECPSCAYALEGLHSLKCPECGYTPEPEELAGAQRRRIYFELTRWSQFSWLAQAAVLFLIAVALGNFRPVSAYILGAVIYILPGFIVGQWSIARLVPQAYRPLVRRMWRQNLVWMQLPWLAVAVTFLGLGVLSVVLESAGHYGASQEISEFLWSDDQRRPNLLLVLPLGLSGLLAAPVAWRWNWRRLIAMSGLPIRTRDQVSVWLAVRAALIPAILLFLVPAVFATILAAIDRISPNWWRNF